MAEKNTVVAVYNTHTEAEAAVKELQKSGFDMKRLSIVGKDYHTEEHVVGYYNTGDRMRYWGKLGAFWGALWGALFGSAVWPSDHPASAPRFRSSAGVASACQRLAPARAGVK